MWCDATVYANDCARQERAYLLHDTRFALGESDVATRLVLDKFDLDLAALAAGLVIIVVVVVHVLAGTSALDAAVGIASSEGAIAIAGACIVVGGRGVGVVVGDFSGHDVWVVTDSVLCLTLTLWGRVWGFSLLKDWGRPTGCERLGAAGRRGGAGAKKQGSAGDAGNYSTVVLRLQRGVLAVPMNAETDAEDGGVVIED